MNTPPISRRMSNRLAARAALISSSSLMPGDCESSVDVPGIPKGLFSLGVIGQLLSKDDVQGNNQSDGHAAEQPGRPPPQLVTWICVDLPLLGAGKPPDEAT